MDTKKNELTTIEVQTEEKRDKARKRKDWAKNAAIIFLALMLLLTFFSNTIMNYSLAEVATQYVESGEISPQVRGTGTVNADDPYNVTISETRKIASVAVKVGDHVKKDDVLYVLEDVESTELTAALKELSELKVTYETAMFAGDVPNEVISSVRGGEVTSMDEYQAKLADVNARYDLAEQVRDQAQVVLNNYEKYKAVDDAHRAYGIKTPAYEQAQIEVDRAEAEAAGDTERLEDLTIRAAELSRDVAQLTNEMGQVDDSYTWRMAEAEAVFKEAERIYNKVKEERDELVTAIAKEISLVSQRELIAEKQEEVNRLKEKSVGGTITAPVDGTISSLAYVAGESTKPEEPAAVIQVDGKPMTLHFSVTTEQARKLKVGDAADPQNRWYYSDFKATLSGIKNDATDPAGKKELTFTIDSPEVQAGQSVSLVMGEAAVRYDMTVPNAAIREDNNGKFILIVESKATPLSNRYIARRVDVEVLASDDTRSAISGTLQGYEYVITTTSKPVKAGDQVRLASGNL